VLGSVTIETPLKLRMESYVLEAELHVGLWHPPSGSSCVLCHDEVSPRRVNRASHIWEEEQGPGHWRVEQS